MSYCTLEEAWGPLYTQKKKKSSKKKLAPIPSDMSYQDLNQKMEPPKVNRETEQYRELSNNFENIEGFSDNEMDSYQDLRVTSTENKNLSRIGDNLMNDSSNLLPMNNTNYNIDDVSNNYDYNSTLDTNYHLDNLDNSSSLLNQSEPNLVSDEESNEVNELNETNLKLDKMEQKIDFILDKVNLENSEIESIDNIHDIILFVVLGVFTILVLDAIFKIGFRLGKSN